jgi:hypothetical protein
MASANEKHKIMRVSPTERMVARWIEHAKKLPIQVSY